MKIDTSIVLDPKVLPPNARLEEWGSNAELDDAANAAYEAFRPGRGSGIQRAKRSKLLHLKRPWLVPIHDSRIEVIYKRAAIERGRDLGQATSYWEVIRNDLVDGAGDLDWLSTQLSNSDGETQRQMSRLTPLRLLDVMAWSLAEQAQQ